MHDDGGDDVEEELRAVELDANTLLTGNVRGKGDAPGMLEVVTLTLDVANRYELQCISEKSNVIR